MICKRLWLAVSGAGGLGARKAGVGIAAAAAGVCAEACDGIASAGVLETSASACTAGVDMVTIMATSVPVAAPARMQITKGVLMLVLRVFVRITIRQFY